jgi:ribosome-binding factor A
MALNKRAREQMRAHCGEIHDDDAVDPREFFGNPRSNRKESRKAKQLCQQVAETLDQVLAGELDDDALRVLRVVSIAPAPDSSRLLVTLYADCAAKDFDQSLLEQRLGERKGRLRCEISAAITRRKAPTLSFNIIGPRESLTEAMEGGQP